MGGEMTTQPKRKIRWIPSRWDVVTWIIVFAVVSALSALIENHQWLAWVFAGVGVILLGIAYALAVQRERLREQQQQNHNQNENAD